MNRISLILLNIAAALYLFANGIMGVGKDRSGEFVTMVRAIFGRSDIAPILIVVLSVCGIAAGILLLLSLFKIEFPIKDILLLVFIIVWVVFIVSVDIIGPLQGSVAFLPYLVRVSTHLMVLGTLLTSTKRFGL